MESPARRSSGSWLLGLWAAAVCLCGLVDGLVVVQDSTRLIATSLLLAALGVIVAAVLSAPVSIRSALRQIKLGPWFGVGFSIVFGLSSLVWLGKVEGNLARVDQSFLIPAAGIVAVGLGGLAAGYKCTPSALARLASQADRSLSGRAPENVSAVAVIALWTLSVSTQVFSIAEGSFGYLSNPALSTTSSLTRVLALLADVGILASALAGWRYGKTRAPGDAAVLFVVMTSQMGLGLFAAMKEDVIVQLVAAVLGYSLQRRVRALPVMIAGLLLVALVVPFVTQYRLAVLSGGGRLSPGEALTYVDFEALASDAGGTDVGRSLDQLAERLARLGDVAVIVDKTPVEVPYRQASDLIAGPVLGLIPRSLWPEKPVLDAGYQMSSVYYGLPRSVYTSSALTPYGDLWRHGGIAIVLLGMASLGVLARLIDARDVDPRTDPRALFLPLLLLLDLVKQESDFLSFTAGLFTLILTSVAAARLVTFASQGTRGRAEEGGQV